MAPTPVLLPGKSHGRRSLVGCSPWGREESHMTEWLHFHFSLSCTGEGNGNPLQCSCLENPRDGGTWWAAVSGVAQSRTRLKRLSSSNSRKTKFFFFFLLQSECFYSGFEDVSGPGINIRVSFRYIHKKCGETYKTQAPPTPPICVKELDNLSASPDIHFFEFCNSLVLNIFFFFSLSTYFF